MKSKLIYKTVRAKETEDLDKKVNEALGEGFDLHGNPYSMADGWLCQALVKEDDSKGKPTAGYL